MDNLEIIDHIIEEHKIIRGQLRQVGDSLNDKEAILNLEKARQDLLEDFKSSLDEKRKGITKILYEMTEGLKKHYSFEEQYLPPLLGQMLTEALKSEHRMLMKEMDQAQTVIGSANINNLNHDQLMDEQAVIWGLLNRIRRLKEEHLSREEGILFMLQLFLQEKSGTK